jgi:branched-chain amino acid aminotransferase
MIPGLSVTPAKASRIGQVDFENLGFGPVFSDHMFVMDYENGTWTHPRIVPYGPVSIEPGVACLHYGQMVFDGLKAFWGDDEIVRVFRPEMNARRLQDSCERLCIPPIDTDLFCDAVRELIPLDRDWIPRKPGQSLYVRPLIIGMEEHLEVRPSSRFTFFIMTAPVASYFQNTASGVSLYVEHEYTRAAPGGLGYAKTAANYAASLYPTGKARAGGADQILWLDGAEHRYVEEVGAMNIFFKIDGTVVTPPLSGTILPGVTRDSVLTLLHDQGVPVVERRIAIDEIVAAFQRGTVEEIFGAGTAAVVCPVRAMTYKGQTLALEGKTPGPVTMALYEEITGIQNGARPDRHGWNMEIPLAQAKPLSAPKTG